MKKKQLAAVAVAGVLAAGVLSYGVSAQAGGFSTDYTITIPATVFNVGNEEWNYAGNITVAQNADFDTAKKITVKAESAHDWKLTKDNANDGYGGNYVSYTMHNGTADAKGDAATSWEFSADQVRAEGGAAQGIGIDVEKYTVKNLDAGNYQDTVTFTAKVKSAAETPSITQADCTFSPSNGKSTLSNANITTSMEYSADNGTTWTDVTSAGSIASLAAGTVQIRVKETDDKLASEAVSITVPEVLHINELVGPYTGDRLTCEYYAGETWQALVDRYDLIKVYSGRAAFGSDGFIYYENGSAVPVTDLVDNTKTYEVQ